MSSPNTKRKRKRKGSLDLYNTPKEAVLAAFYSGVFDDFDRLWDPCAGLGDLSRPLISLGLDCIESDRAYYGLDGCYHKDFFTYSEVPNGVDCIVMNPPYVDTEMFLDWALTLCPNVIMFNRATVLESLSRSKKHMTRAWPLEKFWSFGNRVSCTEGRDRLPTANAVWYGWFKYNKAYKDEPKIGWLFT